MKTLFSTNLLDDRPGDRCPTYLANGVNRKGADGAESVSMHPLISVNTYLVASSSCCEGLNDILFDLNKVSSALELESELVNVRFVSGEKVEE